MNATITYRLTYRPSPLCRCEDDRAYVLVKCVTPEIGDSTEQDVAIFNLDSEARLFAAHVFTSGLDGKLVDLDRNMRESLELAMASKRSR